MCSVIGWCCLQWRILVLVRRFGLLLPRVICSGAYLSQVDLLYHWLVSFEAMYSGSWYKTSYNMRNYYIIYLLSMNPDRLITRARAYNIGMESKRGRERQKEGGLKESPTHWDSIIPLSNKRPGATYPENRASTKSTTSNSKRSTDKRKMMNHH